MGIKIEPISKKSLATAVFEQLRDKIVHGAMEAGETLPSERVLCEHLQVNRGAVREGLKRLEQAGLVSIHQGGATSVRDFRKTAGLEILGAMVVGPGGIINTDIVRSVIDMRATLALQVAGRAAAHCSSEDAESLFALVAQMKSAQDDILVLQELAMQFWGTVVGASKSLPYQLAYNSMEAVYSQVQEHLSHVLAEELRALKQYEALAKALQANNKTSAQKQAAKIVGLGSKALELVLTDLEKVQ
ncbi:MAG: FadR family transcriptional regulator [Deltaproteobacteria bacterium]|nr:FadR family transcriptional regulator [Deltaproteobacteria bacterium]MBT6434963.1 FadR family transcriptional regulator [Deltaproteobacteria bacterium]